MDVYALSTLDISSEQYRALMRVRYRRFLVRRGVPADVAQQLRSLEQLRGLAIAMCRALPQEKRR